MLGWIAIIVGIVILTGIAYYYKDGLKAYYKKNKKKIAAVGTGLAIVGAGSGVMLAPEGYRPNATVLITNSNGRFFSFDGSADNVQIQAAIDDCGAYGWVQLPEGTFDLDAHINMDDNIWLRGAGREVTILKADANLVGTGIVGCSNEHNFTISDLTVDGDLSGGSDGNNIQCVGCDDFIIENVNSHNSGGSAFRVEDCRRGHVTDCFAWDIQGSGQHGFAIKDGVECIFSDLTAWDVSNDGCGLDMTQSEYCEVLNLNINNCYHGIKVTGVSEDYSENNLYSNVHLVDIDTTAGVSALYTSYCKNLSCSNFDIDGCDIGVHLTGTGNIQLINFFVSNVDHGLQIYSDDVTITNFVFDGDTGSGFALHCLTQENVYLSNCHFIAPYGTPTFDQVDNLTIIGCTFMDGEDGGLRIDDCNDVIIDGCKSNGNDDNGLDVIGVCTNFSISDSQFKNNGADGTGYGIDISATAHDNYIILGNVLTGNTNNNDDDGTGAKDVNHNLGTWV